MADKLIVLANDGLEPEGISIFNAHGIEVDITKKVGEDLIATLSNYDALVVRSDTKVTEGVIKSGGDRLKIVTRAGVGYDNIDVRAASEYGVVVKIAPNGNTISTAEHALALMLAVSRKIPQAHAALMMDEWKKKEFEGVELSGKRVGIIGCGRIGRRLSELLIGFGNDVIGYDPNPHGQPSRIRHVPLDELLTTADYISVHASAPPGQVPRIIGEAELAKMKSTAYLVSVARGGMVDESALYSALQGRRIAGAGIDVFVKEGKGFVNPYKGLHNVVVTPHLGASTKEAQIGTAKETAEVTCSYLLKGDWQGAVNAEAASNGEERPVFSIYVLHEDQPGMFAAIDGVIASHRINIKDNNASILGKGTRKQAIYQLHQEPTPELIADLRKLPGVYSVKK